MKTTTGWRPIETAPKDGGDFLATGRNFGSDDEPRHFAVVHWHKQAGEILSSDDYEEPFGHLTHWMPLPEPPVSSGTGG